MVYVLTILAALIVSSGEVVQQRTAAKAPPEDNLSPRLLLWLVRQPRWLAGVGFSLAGNLAFAAALNRGSVVLVEAVFVVRLIFGLTISALWGWHRVPGRDLVGGFAIAVGLAAFLVASSPKTGEATISDLRWALGAGFAVLLAAIVAVAARRLLGSRRALLLGLGAGLLFGVQASLVQAAVRLLTTGGLVDLLSSWHGYAVVAVALFGMLLVQSAFESSVLSDSYPAIVTAQLFSAMAIGVFVMHGHLRVTPLTGAVGVVALASMVAGMVMLTKSPLVTGESTASETGTQLGLLPFEPGLEPRQE